jgi:hypothetical protein
MIKIIISTAILGLALCAQAADAKKEAKPAKQSDACCATKTATQTKADCASSKSEMSCCSKDSNVKTALLSPKAAGEVTKKL